MEDKLKKTEGELVQRLAKLVKAHDTGDIIMKLIEVLDESDIWSRRLKKVKLEEDKREERSQKMQEALHERLVALVKEYKSKDIVIQLMDLLSAGDLEKQKWADKIHDIL